MSVSLSTVGGASQQFFDNSGNPLSGGQIYTYAAGTTIQQATYTTYTGLIANSNPIILNTSGIPANQIWLTDGIIYKFSVFTNTGVLVGTYDNLPGIQASGVLTELAQPNGSSLIGFIAADANAVARTEQSKLREIISVKDFGAVGDGIIDDTVAIQAAINYSAYTPNAPKNVFMPSGKYKITDTIQIGYGTGSIPYVYITFEGETSYGNQGSLPLTGLFPTFNDRPAINVQGGRRVAIKNISLTGVNYVWANANSINIPDRLNVNDWYGPNISASNNTRYAPYVGICIDR